MITPVLDENAVRSEPRRRLLFAAGAVAWLVLYQVNLPWWDWVVDDVAGLGETARLGGAVHFFLYDTTKIALLFTSVISVVTVLRSFISVEPSRAPLGGRSEDVGNVVPAGLGVATPFCSCSAVPAFVVLAGRIPTEQALTELLANA